MNEKYIYRLETIENTLTELCQMKCPGVTWAEIQTLSFLELSPFQNDYKNERWANDDIVHKAVKYRDEQLDKLTLMSDQEIVDSYEETHAELVGFMNISNENILNKHAFYNRPESKANINQWLHLAYWTIEEAVSLSLGKDPKRVNSQSLEQVVEFSSFVETHRYRLLQVTRAVQARHLKEQIDPKSFIHWATKAQIDLPDELQTSENPHNRQANDSLSEPVKSSLQKMIQIIELSYL